MPTSIKAKKAQVREYYSQAEAYLDTAGDAYYKRNEPDFGKTDPIMPILEAAGIRPTAALEIGCANGWLLRRIKSKYDCEVRGVEPSAKACAIGNKALGGDYIKQGVAQDLSMFQDNAFDLVIYGWCLWLCDPRTIFKVVAEGDRVLREGGFLIVLDGIPARPFWYKYAPPGSEEAEKEMVGWMMDHTPFWLAHPGYRKLGEAVTWKGICNVNFLMLEAATLMQKNIAAGIPPLYSMRSA